VKFETTEIGVTGTNPSGEYHIMVVMNPDALSVHQKLFTIDSNETI
jgi:hypothetical protein